MGSPSGSDNKESTCKVGEPRFDPWVGKIPWRREWLPLQCLAWKIPWKEDPGEL